MIYLQRRVLRYRMMRRTVYINFIKNFVTTIKDFAPEVISAAAFMFCVFYLIPLFCGMCAMSAR